MHTMQQWGKQQHGKRSPPPFIICSNNKGAFRSEPMTLEGQSIQKVQQNGSKVLSVIPLLTLQAEQELDIGHAKGLIMKTAAKGYKEVSPGHTCTEGIVVSCHYDRQ